ncbi:unnamed protein product [Gadus morhua 'NCC']
MCPDSLSHVTAPAPLAYRLSHHLNAASQMNRDNCPPRTRCHHEMPEFSIAADLAGVIIHGVGSHLWSHSSGGRQQRVSSQRFPPAGSQPERALTSPTLIPLKNTPGNQGVCGSKPSSNPSSKQRLPGPADGGAMPRAGGASAAGLAPPDPLVTTHHFITSFHPDQSTDL